MGIDGAKIVDGDLAHDLYSEFMSLFDEKYSIAEIILSMSKWESSLVDDIEREIYLSVMGLALWEIGESPEGFVDRLAVLLESGTSRDLWKDIDPLLAADRESELKKYLRKIRTPRKTPRSRKNYKVIRNRVFQVGDCVGLRIEDKQFLLCLLATTFQNRNDFNYGFAFFEGIHSSVPDKIDPKKAFIFGHKVPSTLEARGYYVGLDLTYVEHSDLLKIRDQFKLITNHPIDNSKIKSSSFGYSTDTNGFLRTMQRLEKGKDKDQNWFEKLAGPKAVQLNLYDLK